MKKIAVITTSKELKEFQERTDIRILDINVQACDQTWATQEYFVVTIIYDDDLNSDPDYWTRLEHQAAIAAMGGMCGNISYDKAYWVDMAENAIRAAHALVEKMKEERK